VPDYRYTFTDLLTGAEKGTFPMEGVSFAEQMSSVGKFTGRLPTTDPAVRAQDPWGATEPRKSGLYVERDGDVVWGGIVWGRTRDQGGAGMVLTAATFESWLAYAFLRADTSFVGAGYGAPSTFRSLASIVQGYPSGNVRLDVQGLTWPAGAGGDGTGETRVGGKVYLAADVRPLADIFDSWVTDWKVPVEWRVDVGKGPAAGYVQTLLVSEGPPPVTDLVALHYPGEVLTWTLEEDGTAQATELVGSGTYSEKPDVTDEDLKKAATAIADRLDSGQTIYDDWSWHGAPAYVSAGSDLLLQEFLATGRTDWRTAQNWLRAYNPTGGGQIKLFGYRIANDVGSDELTTGGYPLLGQSYSVGGSVASQTVLTDTLVGVLLDRLAQGEKLTNLTVLPDLPDWNSYQVGDTVMVEITDPSFPEYPSAALFDGYRITGREITPPDGDTAERVKLTVVPPADRLPRSVTVTAQLRDMLTRLRYLETRP
jgi:hypothetical protein